MKTQLIILSLLLSVSVVFGQRDRNPRPPERLGPTNRFASGAEFWAWKATNNVAHQRDRGTNHIDRSFLVSTNGYRRLGTNGVVYVVTPKHGWSGIEHHRQQYEQAAQRTRQRREWLTQSNQVFQAQGRTNRFRLPDVPVDWQTRTNRHRRP